MKRLLNIMILPALLLMSIPATAQTEGILPNPDETVVSGSTPDITTSPAMDSADQAADEAYMRGTDKDYREAIALYRDAMAQHGTSAALYYNLGNAYYRVDSLAKAIICYERALRLDPTDEDIRANLDFVNSKIIDVQATDGMSNILVDKSLEMFSANGWAIVSVVIFICVLLLAAGYIFSRNVRRRKVYFFAGVILLLINVMSIIITVNATAVATGKEEAIVTAASTQLSTSPSTPLNESQKAMLLHEGSKVKVVRELSTPNDPRVKKWVEVEVGADNRAWIDADAIEII